MRFKSRILALLTVLVLFSNVHGSYAWLTRASNPVENSFTIGDIQLTLTESTGANYKMTPGVSLAKDPRVTVLAGSEPCWLFVELETTAGFDSYITYSIADGWLPLQGQSNVYFRAVNKTASDIPFVVLAGDTVTVMDTVTEEQLAALTVDPAMTFFAYAVQQVGIATAEEAWQQIVLTQE